MLNCAAVYRNVSAICRVIWPIKQHGRQPIEKTSCVIELAKTNPDTFVQWHFGTRYDKTSLTSQPRVRLQRETSEHRMSGQMQKFWKTSRVRWTDRWSSWRVSTQSEEIHYQGKFRITNLTTDNECTYGTSVDTNLKTFPRNYCKLHITSTHESIRILIFSISHRWKVHFKLRCLK